MTERARTTAETGHRILQATLELFAERPFSQLTLAAVAERAGVSVQTVIRRFGDKDGLVAAASEYAGRQVGDHRDAAPVADLPGIVDNLEEHYETHGRIALRLLAEEDATPALAEITRQGRAMHRAWCERVFAPYLAARSGAARTRLLAQLVAVCDVYTWKLLRIDAGLSRTQTRLALRELLEPLTTRRS